MKRGDLYRVYKPGKKDLKKFRVFVIVSRNTLLGSQFSTCICAPVYSRYDGLSTQVAIGTEEGLKHSSSIHCDELVSLPKSSLTHFIGSLSPEIMEELNSSLKIALAVE